MALFNSVNLRKFLENMVEPTTANPNVQNTSELNPDKNWYEKWKSPQFGGKQMASAPQIAGQKPMNGTDILRYIRKHDPKNESGSVKDGLNIMSKFHKVTEEDDLLSSITPQQDILGGGLYNQMLSAGSKSKSQKKSQTKKKKVQPEIPPKVASGEATPQEQQEYEDSQYEEVDEQVQMLINNAMDCTENKNADLLPIVADLLNDHEIEKITNALYENETYSSKYMPSEFVECVNALLKAHTRILVAKKELKRNG